MKNKVRVVIILFLIGIFSFLIALSVYLIVDEYQSDLHYHEAKYQLEDFDYAFLEGRYYNLYLMALSNENKEGEIYAPVDEYANFGYFYHYLLEYHKANCLSEDTSKLIDYVLYYENLITFEHLLDKCEELKIEYVFEN